MIKIDGIGASVALVALLTLTTTQAQPITEVLTPAQYFECQIAARRATVQGLQARLALRSRVDATDADKRAAADLSRARVDVAMYACGKQNGATLGAYAHRNADALRSWLNANPHVRARLDAEAKAVADLSAQMSSVSPSAKR